MRSLGKMAMQRGGCIQCDAIAGTSAHLVGFCGSTAAATACRRASLLGCFALSALMTSSMTHRSWHTYPVPDIISNAEQQLWVIST